MVKRNSKRRVGKLGPDRKFSGKGYKSTKKKLKEFQKNRRLDAAEKFKEKALENYSDRIKSIVAAGSVARDTFSSESDLDMWVFVDDTEERLTRDKRMEMEDRLKDIADSCGETKSGNHILHVQPPWTVTEYWDMMRRGSPVAHSMTEDAVAIYDTGFFGPIQRLYKMGKLPATTHSAEKRMSKVPRRLQRAERMKLAIIGKDVYYAMTDALQAVLVYMGHSPPAPKHLAGKARQYLVENDLIDEKYVEDYEKVYSLYKGISKKNVDSISGEELDEYIEMGKEFAKEMQKALKKVELNRKARSIQKNYEMMVKTSVAALKALDELPEDPKKLPKAFKEKLVDDELIDPRYENVFGRVLEMKKKLNDKDIGDISEHDVNKTRNYVRGFVREVRDLLSSKGIEPEKLKEELKASMKPPKVAKATGKKGAKKKKSEPKKTEKKAKNKKQNKKKTEKKDREEFKCDECGKTFGSKRGLSIHKGKVH